MFFAAICVGGPVAARLLKMPSLVGKIFVGILLGPTLVPFPISFVMLGETGLILLVIEAGIDIGLTTEATAADVAVPIASALGFLVGGAPL
jgi:Kef-type K+ transport system membrane component KefB